MSNGSNQVPEKANALPASTPLPHIPDHELLRRIGSGSYGEVWLACSVMGTHRAVKVVYRRSFDNERPYEREFAGIQKFEPVSRSHHGLVDILQVGRNDRDGYFYYVMELADPVEEEKEKRGKGAEENRPPAPFLPFSPAHYAPRTIQSDITLRGRLPFEECLPLFLSLASALGHLHQHGLIHRDIKPSNIIFVNGVAKLADIGLVVEQGESKSYVGTEGYIPPEGPGTRQADLFSLGKLFYEIATGNDRTRFPTLPVELGDMAASKGLLELNAIFVKACAGNPRERYESADEIHADLALLQSGKSVKRLRSIERRLAQATRAGVIGTTLLVVISAAYLFAESQRRIARHNLKTAEQQRIRAERAEQDATEKLWSAYLAQARAGRRSGQPGQRLESLEAIASAAAIRPANELRTEAITCLALTDLRPVKFGKAFVPGEQKLAFDSRLELYAENRPDGSARLCRVADGTEVWKLPFPAGATPAGSLFSHDGQFLATVKRERGLVIWDLAHRQLVREIPPIAEGYVFNFVPNRRWIGLASKRGLIQVIDLDTGKTNETFSTDFTISDIDFGPDGKIMAVASEAVNRVQILELTGGKLLRELLHPAEVTTLCWSGDGRQLFTAGLDQQLYVWNTETGAREASLRGHQSRIVALASLDGLGMLASTSWDGTTRIWNWREGRQVLGLDNAGSYLQHSQATQRLGMERGGSSQLELCEILRSAVCREFWEPIDVKANGPVAVAFSPDERWLVSGSNDGVRLYDLATGQDIAHLPLGVTQTVLFSENGDSLVTSSSGGLLRWPIAATANDEVALGPPVALGEGRMFIRAARDADGELLAYTSEGRPLQAWRGASAMRLEDSRHATTVAVSADGRWIAGGYWGQAGVRLWDATTGKLAREVPTIYRAHVAFTPDSRWLVTGSTDEYCFWDVRTGARGLRVPRDISPVHGEGLWGPIAFSPDGKLMAVARTQRLAQLIEAASGRELALLEHPDPQMITWLAFSPSGTLLAAATEGHVIQMWDLRRLREELVALNLDWDEPPFPPVPSKLGGRPVKISVLDAGGNFVR